MSCSVPAVCTTDALLSKTTPLSLEKGVSIDFYRSLFMVWETIQMANGMHRQYGYLYKLLPTQHESLMIGYVISLTLKSLSKNLNTKPIQLSCMSITPTDPEKLVVPLLHSRKECSFHCCGYSFCRFPWQRILSRESLQPTLRVACSIVSPGSTVDLSLQYPYRLL